MPAPKPPYRRSAPAYDALYSPRKDYRAETRSLLRLVRREVSIERGEWLDVACGTGLNLAHLVGRFRVEGVDASAPMLEIARRRLPSVSFKLADMRRFELGRRFDVVSCLFSSIGYMTTRADLGSAIASLARHVHPTGIVIVEPWFTPSDYKAGTVHMHAVAGRTNRSMHQVRMITAARRGRLSIMDAHHLVGTPTGVEHFVERHEMGLFTRTEYSAAFRAAGLRPTFEAKGLEGRGIYFARPGPAVEPAGPAVERATGAVSAKDRGRTRCPRV